jgi:hypothetical protein
VMRMLDQFRRGRRQGLFDRCHRDHLVFWMRKRNTPSVSDRSIML